MNQYHLKSGSILIGLLFFSISAHAQSAVEHLIDGNDSYKQRDLDQAIYDYSKAIEIDPKFSKAYNNRGVAYAQEGSLDRAIADFTMAIANKPDDAEAYNNRGKAYADKGNFLRAIYDYTKAIEYNPLYIKAYNNRSLAYYQLKEYNMAWYDVHKAEGLGSPVAEYFIQELKKASGEDQ